MVVETDSSVANTESQSSIAGLSEPSLNDVPLSTPSPLPLPLRQSTIHQHRAKTTLNGTNNANLPGNTFFLYMNTVN